MSDANMLRGYSLKKSPLNIQNAKDYKGAERVLVDDEGNQENWWDTNRTIRSITSTNRTISSTNRTISSNTSTCKHFIK